MTPHLWDVYRDITDAVEGVRQHVPTEPQAAIVERWERPLTARECQILQLCADGQSNIKIGAALGLSPLSVKSHLARIGDAMRVEYARREVMVLEALRAGLIT